MIRAYYDPDKPDELPARRRRSRLSMLKKDVLIPRIALLLLLCAALASAGCVYRASISQGNLIKQDDLDQVEIGMTRSQVRFLLGTPLIDDPFHADRWDYVYYIKIGRRDAAFKRWVSIVFEDDFVTEIRKDQELNPAL